MLSDLARIAANDVSGGPLTNASSEVEAIDEAWRALRQSLDQQERERALLLARARGVTPRYPPVLMFHVFLSCIQRGVEVSVRSSLEIEVLRETGAGQKAVEKVGKSTWTNLRDGDELPHVPHPLRPG